jgi:alpha-galactosidase
MIRSGPEGALLGAGLLLALASCASSTRPTAPSQGQAPPPPATALTGFWTGEQLRSDGGRPLWQFSLRVESGVITGLMFGGGKPEPLVSGTTTGQELAFATATRAFRGRLVGDALHLTLAGRPGLIMVQRTSRDPTPPPLPPLPFPLPPPRPVPPTAAIATPPMGWNSWNRFRTSIDDRLVRETADALVSSGMQRAGYTFINIDDGWEGTRDARGELQPNARFPDMKALADHLHARGLKLGLYSSPGPRTCAGFAGSFGHEAQDARAFARWGVDYLKYDWCSAHRVYQPGQMRAAYQVMGQALADAGRPILYSLCQYGLEDVDAWGAAVGGNLWRTTEDIKDTWASMTEIGFDLHPRELATSRPGAFRDPDMLEVGNGGMSDEEYRTHLSLWAMLAAPFIAGNDLRAMTAATRELLVNAEVIAVDQDRQGRPGRRVAKDGDREVWARPLADGSTAVALFNRGPATADLAAGWPALGLTGPRRVRDLWAHTWRGQARAEVRAKVPPHGVVMLRLSAPESEAADTEPRRPVPGLPIGYCTGGEGRSPEEAKAAGFEFVEVRLRDVAALSDEEFANLRARTRRLGIPVRSAINLLPADMKVVGPELDRARQEAYLRRALARGAQLGIKLAVFGSGGSRTAPPGYPREVAWRELVDFGRRAASAARQHGITIVIEALRRQETNMVNTAAEALALVRAVKHANFQMLVDHFHMSAENEDPAIVLEAREHIRHVQIANPDGRTFPGATDESDYGTLFRHLRRIGYRGGISIEARTADFATDAPRSIALLRRLLLSARPASP